MTAGIHHLSDRGPEPPNNVGWSGQILREVSQETGVPVSAIKSRDKRPPVVRARHIAMYRARQQGKSYPLIGRVFGRHHTTVMLAVRRVEGFGV